MSFPFFSMFFILILILTFLLRRSSKSQETVEKQFWDREREANATRRKDISNLDYITIPLDKFPLTLHSRHEQTLQELSGQKILNLTGYSNTDLKLMYGPANLETLSSCDANFTRLVNALDGYAKELLESGQTGEAKTVLEYAVSIYADAGSIYTMLANIYKEEGQSEKISELISSAEELRSLSKQNIIEKLKTYLP